jgi:hypothetical protein
LERADGQTHLADEMRELIAGEQEQLDRTRRSFLDWWTAERVAELRARFDRVLGHSTPTNDAASRNGKELPARPDVDLAAIPTQVQKPTNGEPQTSHRGDPATTPFMAE